MRILVSNVQESNQKSRARDFDFADGIALNMFKKTLKTHLFKTHFQKEFNNSFRRVYHKVTDHVFLVESIVTYHRISRKRCITIIVTDNFVNL